RPPWPTPAGCGWPRSTALAMTCGWAPFPGRGRGGRCSPGSGGGPGPGRAPPWLAGRLEVGESVAVNGCCVTVAEATAAGFGADLVAETLRRTALGGRAPGARGHPERPRARGR